MTKKIVTEQDFRIPEFRNAIPEDYEFRADGQVVRKDRWEVAIREIACIVGLDARDEFEITDIVNAVKKLAKDKKLGSPNVFAAYIAREIFRCGDEPNNPATRIQYKSKKPDENYERDGGGLIEPSLARFLEDVIISYSEMKPKD